MIKRIGTLAAISITALAVIAPAGASASKPTQPKCGSVAKAELAYAKAETATWTDWDAISEQRWVVTTAQRALGPESPAALRAEAKLRRDEAKFVAAQAKSDAAANALDYMEWVCGS